MKNLIFITLILAGVVFNACSTKDDNYYNRANKASEKSLDGLEREFK
jgi:hypothetical protein